MQGLEVPLDKVPRGVKRPDCLNHRRGCMMSFFFQAMNLPISLDAYVSTRPLQMEVKGFDAEAVQIEGRTSYSEAAEVRRLSLTMAASQSGRNAIFRLMRFCLHSFIFAAKLWNRCGAAGHWQAALPG